MKFDVKIPNWSEGKPLTVAGVEADTAVEATARVVEMVNQRAGYHYCDNLPIGTKVSPQNYIYVCEGCGLCSNGAEGWEFVEVNPHEGTFGWLCHDCLRA